MRMDRAVELAKTKINTFPEMYKDYLVDEELFQLLVEDCRKQLLISDHYIDRFLGGRQDEQAVI